MIKYINTIHLTIENKLKYAIVVLLFLSVISVTQRVQSQCKGNQN